MIEAISFLGSRTEAIAEMSRLYRGAFRLEQLSDEPDFVAFRLPNDDRIELFGPGHRHSHLTTGPIGGFEVRDLEAGVEALRDAGLATITAIEGSPGRTQWVHYLAPDGYIYELVHHPERR